MKLTDLFVKRPVLAIVVICDLDRRIGKSIAR